jgi:hypothetical protein
VRAVQGTVTATALVPGRPAQQAKGARGPAVKLTSYPGTVRQLSVTGLGREARTVIITNGHDITTKALTGQYARRMTIEQRLAEIIQGFCADAVQCRQPQRRPVRPPQALTAALRMRLPGNYGNATPDTLQRRFLETPGEIVTDPAGITIKINRRAYSPVLRHTESPPATTVPGGTDAASTSSSPNPRAEALARKPVDLGSGAARASLARGRRFCAEGPEAGPAAADLIRRPASR